MTIRNPISAPREVDAAWDDLYDAGPVTPPPPMTPRRRRRRLALFLFCAVLLTATGAAGIVGWRLMHAAEELFAAIESPDRGRLEGRVAWDSLQSTLRRDLQAITAETEGAQAQRYLAGLVEVTVAAERLPEALARNIRGRALPPGSRPGSGAMQEAMGPVSLMSGGMARVDFPATTGAVASGIGLCLRLEWPDLNRLRLVALAWPEPSTTCPEPRP